MTEPFATVLAGGHHNALGRTAEVVDISLSDRARLDELFGCLASPDELVRMRAGDALEKICRERPAWFVPQVERLLGEVAGIHQPSVRWHLAQMLQHLRDALSRPQMRRATELLQRNLSNSTDWIVLNVTMDVLTDWADEMPELVSWLRAELERLRQDRRPSVAKRAAKCVSRLEGTAGARVRAR